MIFRSDNVSIDLCKLRSKFDPKRNSFIDSIIVIHSKVLYSIQRAHLFRNGYTTKIPDSSIMHRNILLFVKFNVHYYKKENNFNTIHIFTIFKQQTLFTIPVVYTWQTTFCLHLNLINRLSRDKRALFFHVQNQYQSKDLAIQSAQNLQ